MVTIINMRSTTFVFNLSKEYDKIGKSFFLKGKSRVKCPDDILNEKEIKSGIEKKFIKVEMEMPEKTKADSKLGPSLKTKKPVKKEYEFPKSTIVKEDK